MLERNESSAATERGYCDGLLSTGCDCPWEERFHGLATVRTTIHRPGCAWASGGATPDGEQRRCHDADAGADTSASRSRTPSAASSPHQLAYGILVAARGEREADDIWNEWTPAERRAVAAFTDVHFGPIIRKCCADLVAWKDALDAAS